MKQNYSWIVWLICNLLGWHMPNWKNGWIFGKEKHASCTLCGLVISRPLEKPRRFWWHWQALGKDKKQSIFRHGRTWWHFFDNWMTLHAEWCFFGNSSTALSFTFAAEETDIEIHAAIKHLFSVHLSIEQLEPLHNLFKDIYGGFGYETGIGFYDNAAWLRVAYNEMGGARGALNWLPSWLSVWVATRDSKSRWLNGFGFYLSFHYLDMLLGRQNYNSVDDGPPADIQITLYPDTTILKHEYLARVQMVNCTWKRARWPFPLRIKRAEIECIPPIPEAGKGESSWDQDDDAIHSLTCVANTPDEAVGKLIASVEEHRGRYGLPNSIAEEMETYARI